MGYPRGTWLVIGVEFWERYSFYGMLAILALFVAGDVQQGGFGWPSARALSLVGLYSGAMYAFPALGGWLADHVLGHRRAVALGASIMFVGQALMASPAYLPALLGAWHGVALADALRSLPVPLGDLFPEAGVLSAIEHRGAALDPVHGADWLRAAYVAGALGFHAAVFCLILGNALMKSTLVVLCGATLREDDARREGAFSYYYLGISVGAMLSSFIVGLVSERYGWAWGFASAAVGMAVALVLYLTLGPRWLRDAGERLAAQGARRGADESRAAGSDDGVESRGGTRLRIVLVLTLAVLLCAFCTGWYQMFGSWTLFLDHFVDRSAGSFVVPVPWFATINALVVIGSAPLLAGFWDRLAVRNRRFDIVQKYCFALVMATVGNGLMYVAALIAAHGGKAPLWMPVAGVSVLGLGEIVAWTASYGVVTRAAPVGFASVAMGGWYLLTLGLGGYLSGVTGAWVDSIGYQATFGGIAFAMAVAAVLALALRGRLLRLAARLDVAL